MAAYEDWGDQAKALLGCLHKPSRWSICVVHPHLHSYTKGNIALIGDAVNCTKFASENPVLTCNASRHMVCLRIWVAAQDKAWRTLWFLLVCWARLVSLRVTLRYEWMIGSLMLSANTYLCRMYCAFMMNCGDPDLRKSGI